jgi:DNA-binding LytR/AlgR family response regulator
VEDEPKAMSLLEEYTSKTSFLELVAQFTEPLQAMQILHDNKNIDLVFLDINLPELTGIELAKVIDPSVKIIFTTAYSDFAVKSYEVNTIDYLLKPITYQRFFQAITKAKKIIEAEDGKNSSTKVQSHFFVKSGKNIVQINWNDIFYIEALKEYMSIVTTTDKILVYKRMSELEAIQPFNFKRVHNSFIINIDRIEKVERVELYINKRSIPISKTYREEFFAILRDRLI